MFVKNAYHLHLAEKRESSIEDFNASKTSDKAELFQIISRISQIPEEQAIAQHNLEFFPDQPEWLQNFPKFLKFFRVVPLELFLALVGFLRIFGRRKFR